MSVRRPCCSAVSCAAQARRCCCRCRGAASLRLGVWQAAGVRSFFAENLSTAASMDAGRVGRLWERAGSRLLAGGSGGGAWAAPCGSTRWLLQSTGGPAKDRRKGRLLSALPGQGLTKAGCIGRGSQLTAAAAGIAACSALPGSWYSLHCRRRLLVRTELGAKECKATGWGDGDRPLMFEV